MKKPSLKIYQNYARIYLDEYEGQKEARKDYFAKKWNLNNSFLKKLS